MNVGKAHRIRHWGNGLFEHAGANGRSAAAMRWVSVPTKHDGKGYLRLMHRDPTGSLYGCWILILAVAAKCPCRGLLADEDGPLSVEDLALKTHTSVEAMRAALVALCSPEIGWMEEVELKDAWPSDVGPRMTRAGPARDPCASGAQLSAYRTEQNRTAQSSLTDCSLCSTDQSGAALQQARLDGRPASAEQRRSSIFDSLSAEDLADTQRLAEWLRSQAAGESPLIAEPTKTDLFDIVSLAEHCLKKGRNPLALFKKIAGAKDFDSIPDRAVERGKLRVERYLRERSGANAP